MGCLQRKALVVGGSNGIGLNIAVNLYRRGYHVVIVDRCFPDVGDYMPHSAYTYLHMDLLHLDEVEFEAFVRDKSVELLMITAGFGRVAELEWIHSCELQNMMQVNATALMQIIRMFYPRMLTDEQFYCGVMGSIAGLVTSPAFSVYSASKAAVCRFAESVNSELTARGSKNRILNVSPGSLKGTRFNGGPNDLSQTETLANEIVDGMLARKQLLIPEFDTVYGDVIRRYNDDPENFGVSSYEYKLQSGRLIREHKTVVGYLSGTFDLFHVGHLNLLRRAKEQCDYLVVGVHPDASHKGKETFIPYEERLAIVGGCRYVDRAVMSCREDSEAWDMWHYSKLFVGSDYKGSERFKQYEAFFADKNVEIVYFPYTKGTSSTKIRAKIMRSITGDAGEGNTK